MLRFQRLNTSRSYFIYRETNITDQNIASWINITVLRFYHNNCTLITEVVPPVTINSTLLMITYRNIQLAPGVTVTGTAMVTQNTHEHGFV